MFDLSDRPLVWLPVKFPALRPNPKQNKTAMEVELVVEIEVELVERTDFVKLFPAIFDNTEDLIGTEANDEIEAEQGAIDKGEPLESDPDGYDPTTPEIQALTPLARRELRTFMRLAKGWRKIVDKGETVPFTAANIIRLLARPNFSSAWERAYMGAMAGKLETRTGN